MKISIIGHTGHIEYVLDSDMLKNISLSAAPGSKGERTEILQSWIKSYHKECKVYDNYIEMLDQEKPDIAVVACYFGDHARVILQAIKRGIHVFSEKPVALNLKDLEELKKEQKNSGVYVGAMFGMRYTPAFYTAKLSVDNGAIGKIRLINTQKSYILGERGENFKNHELYGGTIPWVGSHAIDWMYWFSDENFKSVYASQSRLFNNEHGELEVSALCHFIFTGEVFGSVSIDYLRPENAPDHGDDRLRIAGTKGVIEVRDNKVYLINDQTKGRVELPLEYTTGVFDDFLKQIDGQGECIISSEDVFNVTEACILARQSAEEQRIVYFE